MFSFSFILAIIGLFFLSRANCAITNSSNALVVLVLPLGKNYGALVHSKNLSAPSVQSSMAVAETVSSKALVVSPVKSGPAKAVKDPPGTTIFHRFKYDVVKKLKNLENVISSVTGFFFLSKKVNIRYSFLAIVLHLFGRRVYAISGCNTPFAIEKATREAIKNYYMVKDSSVTHSCEGTKFNPDEPELGYDTCINENIAKLPQVPIEFERIFSSLRKGVECSAQQFLNDYLSNISLEDLEKIRDIERRMENTVDLRNKHKQEVEEELKQKRLEKEIEDRKKKYEEYKIYAEENWLYLKLQFIGAWILLLFFIGFIFFFIYHFTWYMEDPRGYDKYHSEQERNKYYRNQYINLHKNKIY